MGWPVWASQSRAVLVIAPREDHFAVGAECRGFYGTFMGKDRLESGVMRPPRGEVGPRGVLPIRIAGFDRGLPALDHPEKSRADLTFLEGRLSAVEVADCQQTIRCGQRCRQATAFLAEVGIETPDFPGWPFLSRLRRARRSPW